MWQLKISDPTGDTRVIQLRKKIIQVGSEINNDVLLRDSTCPHHVGTIWAAASPTVEQSQASPYWFKAAIGVESIKLGDIKIREANIPAGQSICVGETKITLLNNEETAELPKYPKGARPWLTWSEKGAALLWTAKKAATTPLSIYLAGETGTGKEVLAHLLHAWSKRASGPFVPINCGALSLNLAESELFGHVKGAFTGASTHRPGALIQAHNGTLFLDEIGDLPMDIQVKLLRFLENGEIRAVGSDHSSHADVRILCATHQPLHQLVKEGRFRRDLYYRLASITMEIPPLRERQNDIEKLAVHFASELDKSLSERAIFRLKAHSWPGNVRELRHAIERASGLASPFESVLSEKSFDFLLTRKNINQEPTLDHGDAIFSLEEMERIMLLKALKLTEGNRSKASSILGIARSTLFEMMRRHKIQGPKSVFTA